MQNGNCPPKLDQGTTAVSSTAVRSPNTEIASAPWQPIESAPRDGTAIWVLLNGWPYIGYCQPRDPVFNHPENWFVKASFRRRDRSENLPDEIYGTYDYNLAPTHWMPLPSPPQTPLVDNLTGASATDTVNCPQSSFDARREEIARVLLDRRGFGFYLDPMEGGQDAYDLTLEALADAAAILALCADTPLSRPVRCTIEDAGESQ